MLRLGIICPSEIALRRFMPALQQFQNIQFVGLAVSTYKERFGKSCEEDNLFFEKSYKKAQVFVDNYGGKIFNGYYSIATSDEIDALYIPLPPALHYKWAKVALEHGKHVLVEKPSTLSATDTKDLVDIAKKNDLALHENYMFIFHNQLSAIDEIINSGEIGDIRLYRISFGFPQREIDDFRYNRVLGGGALIDAGGYTIKYASYLLGESAQIAYAQMNYLDKFDVDVYGSGAMVNSDGVTVQLSFGMDNNYKCELEVWGSKGCLTTGRILTAPAGFIPQVVIRKGNNDEIRPLPQDDAFKKSIQRFINCIDNIEVRKDSYKDMVKQSILVDNFKKLAKMENK